MTKNINCRHCLKPCKNNGKTECSKYEAIAERPNQLPILIRKALNEGNYKEVEKLKEEQHRFNHG